MQLKRWTFKPGLLPTLATLALMALTFSLGQWQLDRAAEKRSLAARFDAQLARPVSTLPDHAPAHSLVYRRVRVEGHYLAAQQMLVDNRVRNKQAGVEIVTPLRTLAGEVVLINRGWLPLADRQKLPEVAVPPGPVTVEGIVTVPSARYLELSAAPPAGALWQNLDPGRMGQHLGLPLRDYVIVAQGPAESGLDRRFERPDAGVATHEGYALQWFLLCATLLVIYVVVNIKRIAHA